MLLKDGRILEGDYDFESGQASTRMRIMRDSPPDEMAEWGWGEPPERVKEEAERLKRRSKPCP